MASYIFSNHFQFLKKRRRAMEEWDDKFFVSLVKKRRYDDMEGVEDSSTCVTALASIAKNEKKKKTEKDVKRRLLLDNC